MQGKTRSQKPKLALGLEIIVNRRMLSSISEVVGGVDVSIESCLNVESVINPLVGVSQVHIQIEENDLPSNLNREVIEEANIIGKEKL